MQPTSIPIKSGDSYVRNLIAKSPKLATILQKPPQISDLQMHDNRGIGTNLFVPKPERLFVKNPWSTILPTRKIANNLKKLEDESMNKFNKKAPVVLVLGGSFNPVHSMHVKLFEAAKNYLKSSDGYEVVGGFLAPSSDDYVREKSGKSAISLKHRKNICDLATRNSDWIDVCDYGLVAVKDIIKMIRDQLNSDFPLKNLKVMEICGADHALKFSLWNSPSEIICVGRAGCTDQLSVHSHDSLLEECKFHIVHEELEDISSSQIRQLLKEGKFKELEDLEWLNKDVLQYIFQNDTRMFY